LVQRRGARHGARARDAAEEDVAGRVGALAERRFALHDVFTAQPAVVANLKQARWYFNFIFGAHLAKLLGHHCVQALRHDGARHDLHAFAFLDLTLPGFTGQSGTNNFE
jgi:hypothetical protein